MPMRVDQAFPIHARDTERVRRIKAKAQELLQEIVDSFESGGHRIPSEAERCRASARTNLEQAISWAEKGIAYVVG